MSKTIKPQVTYTRPSVCEGQEVEFRFLHSPELVTVFEEIEDEGKQETDESRQLELERMREVARFD